MLTTNTSDGKSEKNEISIIQSDNTFFLTNSKNNFRTATNVYLLNVAMADLAILVLALPNELYHLWQHYPWRLGDFACDVKVVVQEAITYVSILTILGIGSEIFRNKWSSGT